MAWIYVVSWHSLFCRYSCVNKNPQGYQDDIRKRLIGCVVLTRYNNKTYRVDDIAFDQSPQTTFEMADGSKVSFVDYYRYVSWALLVSSSIFFVVSAHLWNSLPSRVTVAPPFTLRLIKSHLLSQFLSVFSFFTCSLPVTSHFEHCNRYYIALHHLTAVRWCNAM